MFRDTGHVSMVFACSCFGTTMTSARFDVIGNDACDLIDTQGWCVCRLCRRVTCVPCSHAVMQGVIEEYECVHVLGLVGSCVACGSECVAS